MIHFSTIATASLELPLFSSMRKVKTAISIAELTAFCVQSLGVGGWRDHAARLSFDRHGLPITVLSVQ
jgi:hypothetical protein